MNFLLNLDLIGIVYIQRLGEWALVTKKQASSGSSEDVPLGNVPTGETPSIPKHFEQAIAELESIVASMERGDLSLEASLTAYERGVVLARACQTQLQQAEQQVKVLEQDLLRPMDSDKTLNDSE